MQTKLFYEDEYEALNLMVSNSQKAFPQAAGREDRGATRKVART